MIIYYVMNEAEDAYIIDFEYKSEADEWLEREQIEGRHLEYHVVRREFESNREKTIRLIKEAHKIIEELAELHGVDTSKVKDGDGSL